jgi:hypothetical protein
MRNVLEPKRLVAVALPYGFFVSSLNLLAYWQPLGLMPFYYTNAIDLLSAALAGLTLTCVGLAFGALAGMFIAQLQVRKLMAYAHIHVPDWASFAFLALIAGAAVWCAVWGFFFDWAIKWFFAGLCANLIACQALIPKVWFQQRFPSPHSAALSLLVGVYAPFAFYGYGEIHVRHAMDPARGLLVDVDRSDIGVASTGPLMYMGVLGDFQVLWDTSTRCTMLIPKNTRLVIGEKQIK